MTPEELQLMLSEMSTADPTRQGEISSTIYNGFTSLRDSMTEGVPEGYETWKDAYGGLRREYVNRFMGADKTPREMNSPNKEKSDITDNGGPVSISDLFRAK